MYRRPRRCRKPAHSCLLDWPGARAPAARDGPPAFQRPAPVWLLHSSRDVPRVFRKEAHRTGSEALAQPRQKFHAGIAVGWLHADFALEIAHGNHGVIADAPVGAAGIEPERGQTLLGLLDFGQGRGALA